MISSGLPQPGLDPFSLDRELQTMIEHEGGIYIDILPDYRSVPNAEQGYFAADGHFNADGHVVVTRILADKLMSGAVPALSSTSSASSTERGQ
jgi:hypothetical protein